MVNKVLKSQADLVKRTGRSAAAISKACSAGSLVPAIEGGLIDFNHSAVVAYIEKQDRRNLQAPAAGIAALYDAAVSFCLEAGKIQTVAIQNHFKIGFLRAQKITVLIKAAGIFDKLEAPAAIPPEKQVSSTGYTAREEAMIKAAPLPSMSHDDGDINLSKEVKMFGNMTLYNIVKRFGSKLAFKEYLEAVKKSEDIQGRQLANAKLEGQLVSREAMQKGVIEPVESAHVRLLRDGAQTIVSKLNTMYEAGLGQDEQRQFVRTLLGSFISPIKNKTKQALKNAQSG